VRGESTTAEGPPSAGLVRGRSVQALEREDRARYRDPGADPEPEHPADQPRLLTLQRHVEIRAQFGCLLRQPGFKAAEVRLEEVAKLLAIAEVNSVAARPSEVRNGRGTAQDRASAPVIPILPTAPPA